MDVNILWEKVRELNDKSHLYSEMADWLTQLAQQIEERSK